MHCPPDFNHDNQVPTCARACSKLWVCVILVVDSSSMNLTMIYWAIHLQLCFYIGIVDVHVRLDKMGRDVTPEVVKDVKRDVVGALVELVPLR
jgi:hypothetical protein